MGFKNYCQKINRQLLPVKIHFFLFLAALACALPFRTIFAKQLGLSATAVGVIFFAVPFMRTLSNPLIGFVLDYFKRFRLTISVIMLIVAFSHVAMVFIPPKDSGQATGHIQNSDFRTRVQYLFAGKSDQQMLFISAYNGSMVGDIRFNCHLECSSIGSSAALGEVGNCDEKLNLEYQAFVSVSKGEMTFKVPEGRITEEGKIRDNLVFNSSHNLVFYHFPEIQDAFGRTDISVPLAVFNAHLNGHNYSLESTNKQINHFISSGGFDRENPIFLFISKLNIESTTPDWFSYIPCVLTLDCTTKICSGPNPSLDTDITSDGIKIEAGENEYFTVQFWSLFILITISSQTSSAVMFLMDTVSYEMLQEKKEKYGQQRLWGTVGWGIGALAGGYLNDLVSLDANHIDYSVSFYLLVVICLIDLFVIYQLKVTDLKYSSNIWKDVCQLLSNVDILYNVLIIYFIGVLSGFIWNYQFWFMEEIGASQTLLGLSQAFECISEVPWFLASGWIIKRIGHSNSNSLALLCFALRFLVFQLMYDPWMTLPAALLHGPTFGLFYVSLTMYAKNEAAPGTEGTVQSLMHLSFEGIGAATGVILGGIGFDNFGSRTAFSYATRLSFLLLAVNLVMTSVFYKFKRKTKSCDLTPADNELTTSTTKRY